MALKTKLNQKIPFFITENKSKGIKVKIMIIGPLVNIPRAIQIQKNKFLIYLFCLILRFYKELSCKWL